MNPITCGELAEFLEANPKFFYEIKPFTIDEEDCDMAEKTGVCLLHSRRLENQNKEPVIELLKRYSICIPYFIGGDCLVGITERGLIFTSSDKSTKVPQGKLRQFAHQSRDIRLVEKTRFAKVGTDSKVCLFNPFGHAMLTQL